MRVVDLRQKEVINICTCKSLGCPIDVEFNCATGQITALILPGGASSETAKAVRDHYSSAG